MSLDMNELELLIQHMQNTGTIGYVHTEPLDNAGTGITSSGHSFQTINTYPRSGTYISSVDSYTYPEPRDFYVITGVEGERQYREALRNYVQDFSRYIKTPLKARVTWL